MSLTRISRELHAGPHGKGWDAIYHDFIGQGVWGRLNELYRVYADSHKDRIRRLRNCKASTSGLRKFIKTAQADRSVWASDPTNDMLSLVQFHRPTRRCCPHALTAPLANGILTLVTAPACAYVLAIPLLIVARIWKVCWKRFCTIQNILLRLLRH